MIKKYAAEISQYIEEPGYKAIYIYWLYTIYTKPSGWLGQWAMLYNTK